MQGALALQIILLEMYHCEEDTFLTIQHNLQKVGFPSKEGENPGKGFSWKTSTIEFFQNQYFFLASTMSTEGKISNLLFKCRVQYGY